MHKSGYLKFVYALLSSWLLMLCCQPVWSQDTRFQFYNFNEKDGLSDLFVYSCAQSSDGRMWFGTGSGLYVYDGNEFLSVKSPLDEPDAQIGNILERVFVSSKQHLFLSSLDAFQIYDYSKQQFKSQHSKDAKSLIDNRITSFAESPSGQIWITTQLGFCGVYDVVNQKFRRIERQDGLSDATSLHVISLTFDTHGNTYIFTRNGIVIYNEQSGTQNTIYHSARFGSISRGIFDNKRNCLWLVSSTLGVVKFDLKTKSFTSFSESTDRLSLALFNKISWKSKDELWIGGNELAVFDLNGRKLTFVENAYEDENSFKTSKIQQLFIDRDTNLWICSHFGLSLLPSSNQTIKSYRLFNPENGFTMEPYGTVQLKNGDFLSAAAMCRGVVRYNREKKIVRIVPLPNRSADNQDGSWCVYRAGDIVLIGAVDGLYCFNELANSVNRIELPKSVDEEIRGVRKIIGQGDWIYFQSDQPGLHCYNLKTKRHKKFYEFKGSFSVKPSSSITTPLCVDANGNVWISLKTGVCSLNPASLGVQYFSEYTVNKRTHQLGKISDAAQDKFGTIWLSSLHNGIYRLNSLTSKEIKNFNKANTQLFPSDYCFRLQADNYGYVWIATINGLVLFDAQQETISTVLKKKNGLHKTNVDVALSMINGEILIVNNFGVLNSLSAKQQIKGNYKPRVSKLELAGKNVHLGEKKYELDHEQNFIRISWSSGAYGKSNQILFAYRLKNANETWQYTTETSSNFAGLQPGTYTFEIKARNDSGIWSKSDTLSIQIHPPFYQAVWFYILCALVIAIVIVGVYYYNVSRIRRNAQQKNELTKQVAQIELKALRAQMNPHFVFNSLNSIQKFVLKNDPYAASMYLTKFARLIRLILENSNETSHSIGKEVEQLSLYTEIEQLRFENKFSFELNVSSSIRQDFIKIPSMIVQPFIENAIWHGLLHKEEFGKLKVSFSKLGESCIQIVIEDNGVGRAASAKMKADQVVQKQSLGIKITADRIALLNTLGHNQARVKIYDLTDQNGKATGTRVELIIEIS